MTAGIIIGCMPSAAAVYRSFEPRVTSFLLSKCTRRTSVSRGENANGHAAINSYINLRSASKENPEQDVNAADGFKGGASVKTERIITTRKDLREERAEAPYPLRELPRE